ncbi:hypothetical protein FUA48_10930 [Flavobacterium alkalisoli]|uniref:DUF4468 domain-containing protein n=1 Tax=Flavobacterium alkalisoli TaxID=2602769 RepID=A0A5B9FRS8_9FLAO|nr:hypothetical protein [Flavobacterium alkalisoli]QEE50073.1 hypothetical protein FUA48_10930 [Flavobacterium alkalisoli]
MKKLLLLLLFPLLGFGQHNFSIIKNNLVWEKVFPGTVMPEEMMKQIKLTGKCQFADFNYNVVDFCINYTSDDLKNFGYRVSPYFLSEGGQCTGMVEFKEGRYKVTIFKLDYYDPDDIMLVLPVNGEILKDGQVRDRDAYERALSYFDQYFTYLFEKIVARDGW